MRSETNILTGDLLDTIYNTADTKERDRLLQIIDDIEQEANSKLQFQPNMQQLLQTLELSKESVEHVAIVTRNSQNSLQFFLDKISSHSYGKLFGVSLSRDFRPYKPSPEPLLHISQLVNVPVHNCLMIGDAIDDTRSAKAAQTQSCLFTSEDHWTPNHDICVSQYEPDFVIHSLLDVVDIVQLSQQ
jgi:HAD superfamily hydrolase (TIGR01549 family)